ncbi:MAG: hypothetical protein WBA74_02465 [Cyclobacteriaceae bacterium]
MNTAAKLLVQWYQPVAIENLSKVNLEYIFRVKMAQKYIQKDPTNRFIQLPNRYFDIDNPSGFRGTKQWWINQQKRRQQSKQNQNLAATGFPRAYEALGDSSYLQRG